jgi:hypothetical protein
MSYFQEHKKLNIIADNLEKIFNLINFIKQRSWAPVSPYYSLADCRRRKFRFLEAGNPHKARFDEGFVRLCGKLQLIGRFMVF